MKQREHIPLAPRLALATALFAAANCINVISLQIHVAMPDLKPNSKVVRTSTKSAVKATVGPTFEFDDDSMKLFEGQPKYTPEDESEGSGSSIRAQKETRTNVRRIIFTPSPGN